MPEQDTLYLTTLRTAWTDLLLRTDRGEITSMAQLIRKVYGAVLTAIRTNYGYQDLSMEAKDEVAGLMANTIYSQIRAAYGPAFNKADILEFLEAQRAHLSDQLNQLINETN